MGKEIKYTICLCIVGMYNNSQAAANEREIILCQSWHFRWPLSWQALLGVNLECIAPCLALSNFRAVVSLQVRLHLKNDNLLENTFCTIVREKSKRMLFRANLKKIATQNLKKSKLFFWALHAKQNNQDRSNMHEDICKKWAKNWRYVSSGARGSTSDTNTHRVKKIRKQQQNTHSTTLLN